MINYENKTTYKLVVIHVQEEYKINYLLIAIISGGILFLILIVYLMIRVFKLNRKIKRKRTRSR